MAELARFLTDDGKVDASIAAYMTKQLQLESVTDFANYWAADEYQSGVRDDVVSQIELFKSSPAGKLQVARLRAAWERARRLPSLSLEQPAPAAPHCLKADCDPGSKPIPVQSRGVASAKVCEKGFEVGGDHEGGPLSSKQVERYGDNFKNGLHQPTFHPEGAHKEMEVNGKTYESGFHYLLECHELGGKNEDGGYGGPLCEDPYGPEVSALVEKLLKEADQDRSLCYNNFQDPCPELSQEQVAKCKGFDYGDKTLKLPCGPLPWPAGCPEPGYVPKTNPLHGRWITVSGGQAEFIKEAIKSGMLGQAEAHKIMADTDHEKTGGMFLRINQFGDTCTVDASVAKYARAKRTWRSGHYFYEPLVSGGNLMGVWVLPEEYRKIGFFWEMESGKCFRIERRAFQAGPYTFLRQATEVAGKISFVLYVKVSSDPGSKPIPVQSRDYTALAGCDNVCTNLGKPYPCTAKDLDAPKKRDAWLDQNKRQMLYQRDVVASTFKAGATQ